MERESSSSSTFRLSTRQISGRNCKGDRNPADLGPEECEGEEEEPRRRACTPRGIAVAWGGNGGGSGGVVAIFMMKVVVVAKLVPAKRVFELFAKMVVHLNKLTQMLPLPPNLLLTHFQVLSPSAYPV